MPIEDDDHIIVLTLEGFVMNRVLGDYLEKLLYKILVSIDERTSVKEVGIRINPFIATNYDIKFSIARDVASKRYKIGEKRCFIILSIKFGKKERSK